MDNFQKTVNLKDKAEKERQRMLYGEPEKSEKKVKSKAEGIDEVFKPTINVNVNNDNDLRQINKPIVKQASVLYKRLGLLTFVILFLLLGYFLFGRDNKNNKVEDSINNNWYAVKMDNGDMYYGQIEDTSADPVMVKNVYYDYDQLNKTEGGDKPTGSLRLVKKGKETYGPSGTMELYHAKIISLDVLSQDSKVLKAILDYENKGK